MNKIFTAIFILMIAVVLACNFQVFLFQKNYTFIVESECANGITKCFYRDCNTDGCPPNNLSSYRRFQINAFDFSKCSNDSCLQECVAESIECKEIICGDTNDDICIDSDIKPH